MVEQKEVGTIICVVCGEFVTCEEAEGSYQHPYCKPCFKKVWNDNYYAYLGWLSYGHG